MHDFGDAFGWCELLEQSISSSCKQFRSLLMDIYIGFGWIMCAYHDSNKYGQTEGEWHHVQIAECTRAAGKEIQKEDAWKNQKRLEWQLVTRRLSILIAQTPATVCGPRLTDEFR